ncbi:hypothetical protein Sjap_016916 [Stephania japonica]|uniref:Uncharacterized protein n=1 Tax=Stephania japonica TaxID=461633 RepID=A0AAP0I591_9MAGN
MSACCIYWELYLLILSVDDSFEKLRAGFMYVFIASHCFYGETLISSSLVD